VVDPEQLWSGRIRASDELGQGGMSYVLRGTDTKLRRDLALKVTPLPSHQMPRDHLARFIEEAQITAQLEHPNVVPVHDYGMAPDGRVFFSMKLVRGKSLDSILAERASGDPSTVAQFGLRRLLDVFLQVCQALEYAHARGVVHRDLKPANIMVGDYGEVLVMDWGVAKLLDRPELAANSVSTGAVGHGSEGEPGLAPAERPGSTSPDITSLRKGRELWATQQGTVIGTPVYMSPEQAQGSSVDERADVYALGVLLYEILCGQVPFDDDDAERLLTRVRTEVPRRPSETAPRTPLALEALALQLLAKEPERRLTIPQIRTHVQNYVEGIGRDYQRPSLWSNALWSLGGLGLFAFLVWYLTGQSIAALFVLGPATVFDALGWFLLVLASASPLWAAPRAIVQARLERDRFAQATGEETFLARYLAHRTLATAIAPLTQLVFLLEILVFAANRASHQSLSSAELVPQLTRQLRAEWAQSLIVILVFLFGYLLSLFTEVRFARRIDRYESLVDRARWESAWPVFLILVLLLTIGTTDVLDWAMAHPGANVLSFLRELVLTQPLNLFDIGKTLVFQGTFLLGLAAGGLLLAFPFAEVLAALRLPYQPTDEASVRHRAQYFLRSLAVYRVARLQWLYGGTLIGSLTALTLLAEDASASLVEQVLYILGPAVIGYVGYALVRRRVRRYLGHAPVVARMVDGAVRHGRLEQQRATVAELDAAPWRNRVLSLLLPVTCIAGYLLWTGSGLHQQAIQRLIFPVTSKGWQLILPYALLVPVLLVGDTLRLAWLRRRLRATARLPQ
jgi:serine/threonine protein kinase